MTKKRYLAVAGVLGICMGVFTSSLLPQRTGVTKANFDRIHHGMTITEVEEIFGRKRDSFTYGTIGASDELNSPYKGGGLLDWESSDGSCARIDFLNNRVAKKEWSTLNASLFHSLFGVSWGNLWFTGN